MKTPLGSLPEVLSSSLIRLAANPWNLLLVLLAIDALLHPYAGLHHDAKLYAVQVLNRVEGGFFNQDLFFLHGNQDRYSVFSLVMVPLVRLLGLKVSFFLSYLASKALLYYGAIRLFEKLTLDRRASTLALFLLAITPIPYGGVETFHVNETFFTPRLIAAALVLLGMERLLAGRWLIAASLLLGGLLLHPLMACGGFLIGGFYLAGRWLSPRGLIALAVSVCSLGALVLLNHDLGVRVFGFMDEEWRFLVLRRSAHCFPAEWTLLDWGRIVAAFALVLTVTPYLTMDNRRFALAVAAAGLIGLVASLFAVEWPYALLLQGQPFRVLWLVQLLGLPFGFLLAFRLAAEHRPFPQHLTLVLLYCLSCNFDPIGRTALILLCLFPLLVVCLRGLEPTPRHPQWLWLSAAGSVGLAFSLALVMHISSVVANWGLLVNSFEPLLLVWGLPVALERPVLLLLMVGLAALALKWFGTGLRLRATLLGVWLGYQGLLFGIGQWDAYCITYRRDYADLVFVRETLREQAKAGRPLTIHWPTDLSFVWFDLHAHSYFNLMQTPGNIFDRETAVEGDQRAERVRKFDLHQLRTLPISVYTWQQLARNYPPLPLHPTLEQDPLPPGREDLLRLCADPKVDYLVTAVPVGDDYLATNGKVFIYDCQRIRAGSDGFAAASPQR